MLCSVCYSVKIIPTKIKFVLRYQMLVILCELHGEFITTKHNTQTKIGYGQCRVTAITLTVENLASFELL